MVLRGDGGTGYVRLDWFTPNGLSTWGDGRLTILGTEGYIELRKYVDIAGRPGGDHLFIVDQKETRYIDCKDGDLPFGPRLVSDIVNRTETAMPQAHTFLTMELVLEGAGAGAATDAEGMTHDDVTVTSSVPDGGRSRPRRRRPSQRLPPPWPPAFPRSFRRRSSARRRRATASTSARSASGASRAAHDLPNILRYDTARIMAVCDLDANRVDDGKKFVNDFYAEADRQALRRRHRLRELSRSARQQGHRRRRHQHAGSLARADCDRRRRRPARTSTSRSRRR